MSVVDLPRSRGILIVTVDKPMEREMGDGTARRLERLLPRKEAAQFLTELGLTIAPQTLARLYSEGKGPDCMHIGRRAVYKPADLVRYFREQASAPNRSSREPRLPASNNDLPDAANDHDED